MTKKTNYRTRTWDVKKHEKLERLWPNPSLTPEKIAEMIGVSYQALQSYVHRNRETFPLRPRQAKPKEAKPPKPRTSRYRRWEDPVEIEKAIPLWKLPISVLAIRTELGLREEVFRKMRKFAPDKFPKRDKHNRIIGSTPKAAIQSRSSYAQRGMGVNLKNGAGYLHISGKGITNERALIWRGTQVQASNMMRISEHELTMVPERTMHKN